jgi:hypothetical protein
MAGKSEEHIADVLLRASLSLDEALSTLVSQAGGASSSAGLSRLRAYADNTSCINTGCGKTPSAVAQVERPG